MVSTEPLASLRFGEDADGPSNLAEQTASTDMNDADTDGDELLDEDELGIGSFGPQQVISAHAGSAALALGDRRDATARALMRRDEGFAVPWRA